MKSTVADYETIVYCVRMVAHDDTTVRFAAYPYDLTMSNGTVYKSDSGYDPSSFQSTTTMAASVFDLEGAFNAAGLDRASIDAGNWDNAKAYLFATSWAAPVEDEEPMAKFIFGRPQLLDNRYVVEFTQLIDAVNQSVGNTVGPLCPYTLFDETLDGDVIPVSFSRCTGPRSSPDGPALDDNKVTGTVTHVTSRSVWRDSSRAEADDYFGVGEAKFTTGNNVGIRSQKIKDYSDDGTVTHYDSWPYDIQVGDQYEMIPGCRKRFTEDCVTKWSNGINNGAYPHVVPPSVVQKIGNKS